MLDRWTLTFGVGLTKHGAAISEEDAAAAVQAVIDDAVESFGGVTIYGGVRGCWKRPGVNGPPPVLCDEPVGRVEVWAAPGMDAVVIAFAKRAGRRTNQECVGLEVVRECVMVLDTL